MKTITDLGYETIENVDKKDVFKILDETIEKYTIDVKEEIH